MYAIVEVAGSQVKVCKGQHIHVPRLPQDQGEKITLDKILLLVDEKQTHVGQPYLAGAKVEAEVVDHEKGDKVIVFKKKRRKGYQKKQGHRTIYTQLRIHNISHS